MKLEETDTRKSVLIVSSDSSNTRIIEEVTRGYALEPVTCSSLAAAKPLMSRPEVVLIFCDEVLPDGTYQDFLAAVLGTAPKLPVIIIMLGEDRDETYRTAMEHGAMDVIVSPCLRQDVQWVVIRAVDVGQLSRTAPRV